jgi:hypothetical protein
MLEFALFSNSRRIANFVHSPLDLAGHHIAPYALHAKLMQGEFEQASDFANKLVRDANHNHMGMSHMGTGVMENNHVVSLFHELVVSNVLHARIEHHSETAKRKTQKGSS